MPTSMPSSTPPERHAKESGARLASQNYGIGQPVRRLEDSRLLRGQGRYTDDVNLPGQAYLAMVRSPYAHGILRDVDTQEARAMPGVLGIYTAADLDPETYGTIESRLPIKQRDGSAALSTKRPILAQGKVRFAGDPVAFVVATSASAARDAAEAVILDIMPLPAIVDAQAASQPGAPELYDDIPGNVVLDYHTGDSAKVAEAFAKAAHVVRLDMDNTRLVVAAMEPRSALAAFDAKSGRYTLHIPTQGVIGARNLITKDLLRVDPDKVHVISGDVGGSFGMKMGNYPEYGCALHAARVLGRPIKWTDERSSSFLSDHQGRASNFTGELALDARGKILALRLTGFGNMGAYLATFGLISPTIGTDKNAASVYATPQIELDVKCVLTNTTFVSAYRGAGRPEGNFFIERLLDAAAREMNIDPTDIRRRNFIKPSQMPFKAASGFTYDSGNFPALFERALELADYKGFAKRKRESRKKGLLRGIAVGAYLEVTAGNIPELGKIRFNDDDTVTFLTGSFDFGQGHRTAYLQVLSEKLGIPMDRLRLDQNDSDSVQRGGGSGGSRSLMASGAALVEASDQVIDKGKIAAAHMLESATDDIEFRNGRFAIAGTDRAIGIVELARRIRQSAKLPDGVPDTLDVDHMMAGVPSTFPNGAQVAEVEIDPDTGETKVVSYVGVNDFGTIVNPLIVAGQVHGGIVQGLGQALMERAIYNEEGQLITGSFMDYALPRAADVPPIQLESMPSPTATNPLGVKGCGEAGCAAGLPTIVNAVIAALADDGIHHLDMPLTPEKIWAAIVEARAARKTSA